MGHIEGVYPLGEIVKEYRLEKELSTSELAQIVGVSQATISNLERGKKVSDLVVKKIVDTLEIPVEGIKTPESKDDTKTTFVEYKSEDSLKLNIGVSTVTIDINTRPSAKIKPKDQNENSNFLQYHIWESPVIIETIFKFLEEHKKEIHEEVMEKTIEIFKNQRNQYLKTDEKP